MMPAMLTPWQKVLGKAGMKQIQFARLLGRDPAVVNRGVRDPLGLIPVSLQFQLLKLRKEGRLNFDPADLLPEV